MSETKPSYYELLKHPKWQEKRLRIMERAGFKCEECSDAETTLNVHHGYYRKSAMPWEYEDETLHCLCEPCHEKAEELKAELYLQIAMMTQGSVRSLLQSAKESRPEPKASETMTPGEERLFELLLANPGLAREAIEVIRYLPFVSTPAAGIFSAYRQVYDIPSFDQIDFQAVKNVLEEPLRQAFGYLYQSAVFNSKRLREDPIGQIWEALDEIAEHKYQETYELHQACTG